MASRWCIQYVSKFGRPSSGHRTGNSQSSTQFPRRAVLMNVLTIRQLHPSSMLLRSCWISWMLGFSIYVKQELPDVQTGSRKGRGTRNQVANIHWLIEKTKEFQKNIYLCFIDYAKAFDCVDHNKLWKALGEIGRPDQLTCLQRNLLNVGQEATLRTLYRTTDWFKIEKGYDRAVCCHPVCLIYMLSTSWEIPDWMSYNLESR